MQLVSRGGLGGVGRGGAAGGRELLILGRTQLEASRRGQWTVHAMENSVCSLDGLFPSSPISLSIKMHPPPQPLPILAERDSLEGCFCAGRPGHTECDCTRSEKSSPGGNQAWHTPRVS